MNATKVQEVIEYVRTHGSNWQHGDDGDPENGPTGDFEAGFRLGPLMTDIGGNYLTNTRTGITYLPTGGAMLETSF